MASHLEPQRYPMRDDRLENQTSGSINTNPRATPWRALTASHHIYHQLMRWGAALVLLPRIMHGVLSVVMSLGIHKLLRRYLAYRPVPREHDEIVPPPRTPLPNLNRQGDRTNANDPRRLIPSEPSEHDDRWNVIVTEKLAGQWTATCKGCVLVLQ